MAAVTVAVRGVRLAIRLACQSRQITGGRPMTGLSPLRRMNAYPVPSRREGSWRIMSSVMTGCRVSNSLPRSRHAKDPDSLLAISSVSGSLHPGRNTFVPHASRMVRAPFVPHRDRSCATPCTTGMIWMPRPPASASSDGSGSGQVWVTSSSVIFSFRVSRGCELRRPVVDSVVDGTVAV